MGLSSRDLLLDGDGILSAATCWGEADRGKTGTGIGAEAGGGAVLEVARGDAMAAGRSSGEPIKAREGRWMRCAGVSLGLWCCRQDSSPQGINQ